MACCEDCGCTIGWDCECDTEMNRTIAEAEHKDRLTESLAYQMGYNCGKNGPTTINSHFSHFSTPELTKEWEAGKAYAEQENN